MRIARLTFLGIVAAAAWANVRTANPPNPGAPRYTYLHRNTDGSAFFAHDSEWAAIWFFRDPKCIPTDFNLLDFVDFTPAFTGGPPRPFLCPLTVTGFAIWKNGPFPIDSVPLEESDHGNAVPVWFVRVAEFQAAAADAQLTIGEILAMPSLRKGIAGVFETVDHFGTYRRRERNGSIQTTANGALQDGAAFQVEFREMGAGEDGGVGFLRRVRIDFTSPSVQPDAGQHEIPHQAVNHACIILGQHLAAQAKEGRFVEAEQAVSDTLPVNADRGAYLCAGLAWANLAVLASNSGRFSDSERLALRSVVVLEKVYPREDAALLRPLATLAAARVQLEQTAMARQTFRRLTAIRAEEPADDALVHGIGASLLQLEGKTAGAIAEVLAALRDWERAGRGDAVDAAAALTLLGTLYVQSRRWTDAQQALDRAAAILNHSPETVPMDRIKVLFVLGMLRGQQRKWADAEQNFAAAIEIADREQHVDRRTLRSLFVSYAWILRKSHRSAEARNFEARAAALGMDHSAVVDVSEFRGRATPLKN